MHGYAIPLALQTKAHIEELFQSFLTSEILKVRGGNNYNIPHIRKEMLERQGWLPIQLNCDTTLVNEAIAHIEE